MQPKSPRSKRLEKELDEYRGCLAPSVGRVSYPALCGCALPASLRNLIRHLSKCGTIAFELRTRKARQGATLGASPVKAASENQEGTHKNPRTASGYWVAETFADSGKGKTLSDVALA